MSAERIRSELKIRFPSLPIRLDNGAIMLGDDLRIDTIDTEAIWPREVERLAGLIRDALKTWQPPQKFPGFAP